jgi:hypothetical protein
MVATLLLVATTLGACGHHFHRLRRLRQSHLFQQLQQFEHQFPWFHWNAGGQAQAQAQAPPDPNDPANLHIVTVTFNYDFRESPACTPKTKSKTCIKEFVVYDVASGREKLFTIPPPAGATGIVKGITAKGPEHAIPPGVHYIAVTAVNAAGGESDTEAAKFQVEVKRKVEPAPGTAAAKP